jgi:formate hydrogenlyase subunit 6/NADH:ubiquinone oxidoreductase subunit I
MPGLGYNSSAACHNPEYCIGKAYIDQNRSLSWADHQNCIFCEEMYPLGDKAIFLKKDFVTGNDSLKREIQLPYVNRDLCISCGICEDKCPHVAEAAIRVYCI